MPRLPPILSITRRDLAGLLRMPPGRWWALAVAAAWLPAADLGLRVLGFARVRRWLQPAAPPPRAPDAGALARRWSWAVAAAGHHHLYPVRCLTRSLVLQALLARRGVPCALRIGVRRGEAAPEGPVPLRAHAWVEHDGRPLAETGDPNERFAALPLPGS